MVVTSGQAPPQTSGQTSQPPPSSNAPSLPAPSNTPNAPGPTLVTSVVTQGPSTSASGPVVVVLTSSAAVTTFTTPPGTTSSTQISSSTTSTGAAFSQTSGASSGGTSQTTTIAVAVVVPLVTVALLVLAGIFFWRRRKQRKNNEEMRKAEINDYIYNPNSEPPSGGMGSEDGTTKEGAAGYRGWGTTSTNRKMSTSLSSPPSGMARSNSGTNGPSPGAPPGSGGHASDHLAEPDTPHAETIGELGAAPVAGNRGAGVNRGASNASSAYSGANRSEASALSGEGSPQNHIGSPQYYTDMAYPEDGAHGDGAYGQPVIQDVSARRNTRIENPSVVPQQGNAGISQNF